MYARPDTCRFLLSEGADPNVCTSWSGRFSADAFRSIDAESFVDAYAPRREEGTYRGRAAYS